jgi:hypothetical protein
MNIDTTILVFIINTRLYYNIKIIDWCKIGKIETEVFLSSATIPIAEYMSIEKLFKRRHLI